MKKLAAPKLDGVNLARQLKFYLDKRKLTQTELAKLTNGCVTKQNLNNWVNGIPCTSILAVIKLAEVLGVSVEQLVLGDGDSPPPNHKTNNQGQHHLPLEQGWAFGVYELYFRKVSDKTRG